MKSSRLIYHISCLIYLSYLQNCINYSRLCIIMIHDLHLSSCRGTAAGQHPAASRTSSSAAGASRSRTPPSPLPGCTWSRVTCHVSRVTSVRVRGHVTTEPLLPGHRRDHHTHAPSTPARPGTLTPRCRYCVGIV